jgi:hypothetical protein
MNALEHGQWIGMVVDQTGIESCVVLNIEERRPGFAQALTHLPKQPELRTVATFSFPSFEDEVVISASDVRFFDRKTGALIPIEDYFKINNITEPLPKETHFNFLEKGRLLRGSNWTDTGRTSTFHLTNTATDPVCKPNETLTWKQFKEFVLENYGDRKLTTIFRGQPDNSYKLRTSFHRRKRNNLWAYLYEDIPILRHAVNAVSNYYYRENDSEDLGALLSLAQHHGYPTPLLDWTFSPYIAAFFAFSESAISSNTGDAVRIFVFDNQTWLAEPTPRIIYDPLPSLTFHRFSAHNNPRFVPQQSIASFSNVDDIENLIREREKLTGKQHLTIVDIPKAERRAVLGELGLMGITAGALFPGLDGVCRSLREQFF